MLIIAATFRAYKWIYCLKEHHLLAPIKLNLNIGDIILIKEGNQNHYGKIKTINKDVVGHYNHQCIGFTLMNQWDIECLKNN